MRFSLLEISTTGWHGFSLATVETPTDCRSLFHLEWTGQNTIVGFLYYNWIF